MRALRLVPLLLLALSAAPAAAQDLAGPRPLVVVEDPVLRLGDLFEGAGPRAAQAIGAAPAPGRRMVIEAPQLAAVARAHGLAWRPVSAQERAVVERPGQPVPRDEIVAALRAELLRQGLDPEADLELGPYAAPMVPLGPPARLAAEAASFDPVTGRFGATLVVMADGMPVLRQRLAGRAVATLPVVVATRRLNLGEVVRPGDAKLARQRAERVRPGSAERLEEVVGQQLRRPMASEAAFLRADVAPPSLVEKNALVTMLVEAPGIALTAQGRALDAGPRGGVVPVMNLASRTVVEGQVVGPGRVRVAMGAAPLRVGGGE
ncbi:flagellar basal body P-ring formation chaperone FlgA [Paracraurococcus ruber]|uniref:Flagella basal body P-ring formation protein FlgA n=1 Tax=Paracraurococcus ruber TaxID=77675 RepID=A0ABS1D166_9PROT|nr:flagellar basal body P-ring formation chaperone FlgA [Paracraurococcus ruber]MBK1660555.1 flagella basal body P-ring formation protein FlgA [Paracraurococcus ruber]TDG33241.1 flagellar basal body P-ring formation protein FlgA [Paracraurococcus ruber]